MSVAEIVPLVAALFAAGALGGIIAGLLGVGGGIVIVPVLYTLLPFAGVDGSVQMHLAVGTSLATIIATSANSARAHHRRGAVDVPLLRSLLLGLVLGVVAGVIVGGLVSGSALTAVFAVVAIVVAIYMVTLKGRDVDGEHLPGHPWRDAIGFGIGSISVMMGIGGGTLSVPVFSLFGVPVHRAVGTAAAIGLIIAIPGTIGFAVTGWGDPNLPFASVGYVNLLGFVLIAPISALCAPYGARIAHALPQVWLSRAFALFLFITGVRMLTTL